MAGGIRDDELAPGRREVAIGDIDRDALFALGAQAIGKKREVDEAAAAAGGSFRDAGKLVLVNTFGIVEQTADERALAIVDRAGGREAQNAQK